VVVPFLETAPTQAMRERCTEGYVTTACLLSVYMSPRLNRGLRDSVIRTSILLEV
jgi:hypothetical protein